MAFMKLEDKFGEIEAIIFPRLYESLKDKLALDTIIRIEGTISARDRQGDLQAEAKINAENVIIITETELDNYKPGSASPLVASLKKIHKKKNPATKNSKKNIITSPLQAQVPRTLYIHVKDTNDHDRLLGMKRELSLYPGSDKVVLVLGIDKASAIRLPFKVDISEKLKLLIDGIYGADCVVIK